MGGLLDEVNFFGAKIDHNMLYRLNESLQSIQNFKFPIDYLQVVGWAVAADKQSYVKSYYLKKILTPGEFRDCLETGN